MLFQALSLKSKMLRKCKASQPPHSSIFEKELHLRLGALAPQNGSPGAYLAFKGYSAIERVRRLVRGAKPKKQFITTPPPSRQPSLIIPTIIVTRPVKERKRVKSKKAAKPDNRLLCTPKVNSRGRLPEAPLPPPKPQPTRPLPAIPSSNSDLAFYANYYKDWIMPSFDGSDITELSRSGGDTVGILNILEEEEELMLLI
ncbi:hypothetical protein FA95DRAFT_983115 [Auriscalpium vulgare]|uniref:Uncharacterized protein n=1 Tax=Auriscalpium vulgare TaxID=40419 RepID=A0ACB8R6M7_9AGAM|nr:hypothetical protein FA95DRAFT_983115 [Auriscalpium vulgare]